MMMTKRQFLTALVAAACLFLAKPASAQADDFSSGAVKFIEALAEDAVNSLTAQEIEKQERIKRFRELLKKNFAVKAIGRWVLGRYWRKASKDEKQEYNALFEDLIVATYVNRFEEFSGETLKVIKAINQNGKDAIVKSEIVRPGGQPPVRVDWRVRAPNATYKIVDVIVEGVSMSQTQRSEFSSVIKREGGKVSGLLTALRKKTEVLRN